MELSLNILNFNCWGLRIPLFGSEFIEERLAAIADLTIERNCDIAIFQEVWDLGDYKMLCNRLSEMLPHSHLFEPGVLRSGLCLFSRFPITETVYSHFPLNGHPHKLLHCDWYAAKGCALAVLQVDEFVVNVYNTHMHARHHHTEYLDEYMGHRSAQAFSMSQFVKHTSGTCDAMIMAGDYNSRPHDVAYNVLRSVAVVNDSWLDANVENSHDAGYTSDLPICRFTPDWITALLPEGQRIDYIFYRANKCTEMRVLRSGVLPSKIPGTDIDYSDHSGLESRFSIRRDPAAEQSPKREKSFVQKSCKTLIEFMDKDQAQARKNKYFYIAVMLLSLMMLLVCRETYIGPTGIILHTILEIIQIAMVLIAAACFWLAAVHSRIADAWYANLRRDCEVLVTGGTHGRVKKDN